jgi:hypothetical protein
MNAASIGSLLVLCFTALYAHANIALEPDQGDLRFHCELGKAQYEVGEPIVLLIWIMNEGDASFHFSSKRDLIGRREGYTMRVTDADGREVPDPGGGEIWPLKLHDVTIPPNGVHIRELVLNYHTLPLRPGRYVLQGTFAPAFARPGPRARSPILSFEIVPTESATLERRIADLVARADLPGEASRIAPLLGFTGHPAAIAPLIDLLYVADDEGCMAAADALLYLDRDQVHNALVAAIRTRGPRFRMVGALVARIGPFEGLRLALIDSLAHGDAEARLGALEGLRLANRPVDRELFASLARMLKDPSVSVRILATRVVGEYHDAAALAALEPLIWDEDSSVSRRTTAEIGWMAFVSKGPIREEAVGVLSRVKESGRPASREAAVWLRLIARDTVRRESIRGRMPR